MEHHNEYIVVVLILLIGLGSFIISTPKMTGMAINDFCDVNMKSFCVEEKYYLCSEDGILGPFSCEERGCEELRINGNKMALCVD
jgi:hypothetical protein